MNNRAEILTSVKSNDTHTPDHATMTYSRITVRAERLLLALAVVLGTYRGKRLCKSACGRVGDGTCDNDQSPSFPMSAYKTRGNYFSGIRDSTPTTRGDRILRGDAERAALHYAS